MITHLRIVVPDWSPLNGRSTQWSFEGQDGGGGDPWLVPVGHDIGNFSPGEWKPLSSPVPDDELMENITFFADKFI